MKKRFSTPRQVFGALQVLSVLALLGGVFLFRIPQAIYLHFACGYVLYAEDVVFSAVFLLLFGGMWVEFARMCGRLKRDEGAFTLKNARTMMVIACCCGGLCALMLLTALVPMISLLTGGGEWFMQVSGVRAMQGMLPEVFFGAVFGCGSLAALVLRHLLKRAMALQQEADETV